MAYITQSALAKELGITRQNISKDIKAKKLPRAKNGQIDKSHPDVMAYITEVKQRQKEEAEQKEAESQVQPDFVDLRTKKLMAETRRAEADAEKKELEVARKKKELIERSLVKSVYMNYLNELNRQLLFLGARLVPRIIATVQSDPEMAKIEVPKLITGAVSKLIKNAISRANEIDLYD